MLIFDGLNIDTAGLEMTVDILAEIGAGLASAAIERESAGVDRARKIRSGPRHGWAVTSRQCRDAAATVSYTPSG